MEGERWDKQWTLSPASYISTSVWKLNPLFTLNQLLAVRESDSVLASLPSFLPPSLPLPPLCIDYVLRQVNMLDMFFPQSLDSFHILIAGNFGGRSCVYIGRTVATFLFLMCCGAIHQISHKIPPLEANSVNCRVQACCGWQASEPIPCLYTTAKLTSYIERCGEWLQVWSYLM